MAESSTQGKSIAGYAIPERGGWPVRVLSQSEQLQAIEWAAEGMSLTSIMERLSISGHLWSKFCRTNPLFESELSHARKHAADVAAEKVRDLHKIRRLRRRPQLLREVANNIKWFVGVTNPERYGNRLNLEVEQKVGIKDELDRAQRTAALLRGDSDPIPTTAVLVATEVIDSALRHGESEPDEIPDAIEALKAFMDEGSR